MELMRVHVPTLTPSSTLRDAVDKMDLYQVSGLPVVDEEGLVVGMVTRTPVIDALLQDISCAAGPVSALMATPITVGETDQAADALRMMVEKDIQMVAVVSGGQMAGTLTRVDILQAMLAADKDQLA
jgi:CBS domain-containing protein